MTNTARHATTTTTVDRRPNDVASKAASGAYGTTFRHANSHFAHDEASYQKAPTALYDNS